MLASFYVKLTAGSNMAITPILISVTGTSTQTCLPAAGITLTTAVVGFTRLSLSVGATSAALTDFRITQNDAPASGRTLYIDAVQLQSTTFAGGTISAPTPYQIGGVMLRGLVENPLQILPNGDSTSVLSVSNAAGTNTLFNVDTLDEDVALGTPGVTHELNPGSGRLIGGGPTAKIGSTNSTSATTIQGGSGNIFLHSASAVTITGAAASTWDIGNNTLSIQTTATNGAITTGTGLFTDGGNLTFNGTTARTITGPTSGGLTVTDAGGALTLITTSSGTLSVTSAGALNLTGATASTWSLGAGNALTVTSSNINLSSGPLTLGSSTTAGSALLQDGSNHKLTLDTQTMSASYGLNFPTTAPGTNQCLESGASTAANLVFNGCGGNVNTSGTITTGTIAYFNASTTIASSILKSKRHYPYACRRPLSVQVTCLSPRELYQLNRRYRWRCTNSILVTPMPPRLC